MIWIRNRSQEVRAGEEESGQVPAYAPSPLSQSPAGAVFLSGAGYSQALARSGTRGLVDSGQKPNRKKTLQPEGGGDFITPFASVYRSVYMQIQNGLRTNQERDFKCENTKQSLQ